MAITPPKLMDYSAAIQANQSMSNAFKQLGNTSQDYMDYAEKKKQNGIDNQYKQDVFAETKNQNKFSNQFKQNEFDYGKTRDTVKDGQWGQTFNHNVSQDNIKNDQWKQSFARIQNRDKIGDDQWQMNYDYRKSNDDRNYNYKVNQSNKPNYTQYTTTDANGKPVLGFYDKTTGTTVNTNQPVYQTPKTMSDEQRIYYTERANDLKNKQLENMMKNFRDSPSYTKLSDEQKIKAEEYVRTNGTIPKINYSDGGWFGAESYSMGEAVEKQKKNKLKDGSNRDHLAN